MEVSIFELLRLGARLSPPETLAAYLLPIAFASSTLVRNVFLTNFAWQTAWFVAVVQVPGFLTGKMSYVDIGWPGGLCILSMNCFRLCQGWWVRRWAVCGCLMLHGARMFVGALIMFYPYTFPSGDLSRYSFAKWRWVHIHKQPVEWWPIKQQQETASQGLANSIVLACPIMLAASNPMEGAVPLEIFALAVWVGAWILENIADVQKLKFLEACKAAGKNAKSAEEKEALKCAVLGLAPWDGNAYWTWAKICRHPNYLGEWLVWLSYCIFALPSVLSLSQYVPSQEAAWLMPTSLFGLFLTARCFYDCLVYWTGAEPAEFGSGRKREAYADYQEKLPVLLPFEVRGVFCGHKERGWPYPQHKDKRI